jgi:hypothetical protein
MSTVYHRLGNFSTRGAKFFPFGEIMGNFSTMHGSITIFGQNSSVWGIFYGNCKAGKKPQIPAKTDCQVPIEKKCKSGGA